MLVALVAALLAQALPGAAALAAPGRADDIFARAREALLARTYARELKYAVRVSGLRGETWASRTYDSFELWPSGEIRARSVSREETANPYRPPDFGVQVLGFGRVTDIPDAIGVPRLAPTYAFGLIPARAAARTIPAPIASDAPREIGSASAIARIYDVALSGEETVGTARCYHLVLTPLGNPGKYRLRALWVDVASYQIVRLRTEGNFTAKVTGSGTWTVDYAQIAGAWYLSTEVSDGEVTGDDDLHYDRLRVEFLEITPDTREIYDVGLTKPDLTFLEEPA